MLKRMLVLSRPARGLGCWMATIALSFGCATRSGCNRGGTVFASIRGCHLSPLDASRFNRADEGQWLFVRSSRQADARDMLDDGWVRRCAIEWLVREFPLEASGTTLIVTRSTPPDSIMRSDGDCWTLIVQQMFDGVPIGSGSVVFVDGFGVNGAYVALFGVAGGDGPVEVERSRRSVMESVLVGSDHGDGSELSLRYEQGGQVVGSELMWTCYWYYGERRVGEILRFDK